MIERAKMLRRGQTDAETKLWSRLRADQLGAKFRRQHPVSGYIADFCCVEHKLVVELDGGQHVEQHGYDAKRTATLEALGFRVLRFWNDDALIRTDDVVGSIVHALDQPPPPHPNPLPRRGARRGRGSRSNSNNSNNSNSDCVPIAKTTLSPPTRFSSEKSESGSGGAAATRTSPSPPTRSSPGKDRSNSTGVVAAGTAPSPPTRSSPGKDRSNSTGVVAAGTAPSPSTRSSSGERVGVRGRGSHNPAAQGNRSDPISHDRDRALRLRARLNALIRNFFAERGVIEVETPILSPAGNTEPNIESFSTTFVGPIGAGARERFLRTSPEHPLKRLLAGGFGDCYELGRVFRNGEAGASHNPEFTMLEWYRVGFDHRRLMLECAQLVRAALTLMERDAHVATVSYREWFRRALNLDPLTADDAALRKLLADFHVNPEGLTRDDWLDLLVTHRLQPALPEDAITIVYDFPASQCSLARIRPGNPSVAERFELYLGRHELANGYHELKDAAEQRARFEYDNARRMARGQREMPTDENLLAVLDRLPDCAGVALGVDRLLMHLLGTHNIREVLAFPFVEA